VMRKNKKILLITGILLIVLTFTAKLFLDSIYRLPIIMYHSIDYTADKKNKIIIPPEIFARQMKFLRDFKYNVITLDEAVAYIKNRKRPPARTVAITFDDGYENNYKYAYPILMQYKIPATIFVIVDSIGTKGFVTWDQIREMDRSGIVSIESHTMSHPWLIHIGSAQLERELCDSRSALEEKLGRKMKFVCYPRNGYNEEVKAAARKAGYEAGFATKPTRLSPNYDIYEIKRIRISPTANNLFVFFIKLSGYHSFYRGLDSDYKGVSSTK